MPHGCLIAISGVSGSGKSSLAFDTIYAEARRRYLLSLDLSQASLVKRARAPRARVIEGLAPAIAIDQGRGSRHSARSTAATLTGLHDYLRLLFARLGEPRCLSCGSAVQIHRFETVYETAAGLQEVPSCWCWRRNSRTPRKPVPICCRGWTAVAIAD